MRMLFSLSIIPVATAAAVWLQLMLTDEVQLAVPIVVVLLSACFAWYLKDSPKLPTVGPILFGSSIGALVGAFFIGPAIAAQGVDSDLEALKKSDPSRYEFTIHSTAIIPIGEHHRRQGLRVAIPFGVSIGFACGLAIALQRRFHIYSKRIGKSVSHLPTERDAADVMMNVKPRLGDDGR